MKSGSLAIVLAVVATAGLAQNRVFVSAAHGDDSFVCSVAAPCRSFAHAATVVAADGEILALDSGGYGPVTLSQPMSIVAPQGVEASITQNVSNGRAIELNVSGGSGTTVLRGLSLFGLGVGNVGIYVSSASLLYVDSCAMSGFNYGLYELVTSASDLAITHCSFIHNTINGVSIGATSADFARFDIDNSHFESSGLLFATGARGTIRDSRVSNSSPGIEVFSNGSLVTVQIESCTITRNTGGVSAQAGVSGSVLIRVSNSVIANNTFGIDLSGAGAQILSRINNTLNDNTTDGTFSGSYVAH